MGRSDLLLNLLRLFALRLVDMQSLGKVVVSAVLRAEKLPRRFDEWKIYTFSSKSIATLFSMTSCSYSSWWERVLARADIRHFGQFAQTSQ